MTKRIRHQRIRPVRENISTDRRHNRNRRSSMSVNRTRRTVRSIRQSDFRQSRRRQFLHGIRRLAIAVALIARSMVETALQQMVALRSLRSRRFLLEQILIRQIAVFANQRRFLRFRPGDEVGHDGEFLKDDVLESARRFLDVIRQQMAFIVDRPVELALPVAWRVARQRNMGIIHIETQSGIVIEIFRIEIMFIRRKLFLFRFRFIHISGFRFGFLMGFRILPLVFVARLFVGVITGFCLVIRLMVVVDLTGF